MQMTLAPIPASAAIDEPSAGPGRHALLRTARDVAEDLAADAIARDQAGKPPADEVARLRDAGLPAALAPPGPGRGTDWRTGCAVVREIAVADSSVGELLARHYVHTWAGRFYADGDQERGQERDQEQEQERGQGHDRAEALEAEAAREQWLWTGAVHGPAPHGPHDGAAVGPDLTLRPRRSGYVLHGRRALDTAVPLADQLAVDAVCTVTGDILVVRIPAGERGVTLEPAHDRFGQRVAGAGTVHFDRVTVPADRVLGLRPHDEESAAPRTSLAGPALRLALCHVGLGIAEGALTEARDLSRGARAHRLPGEDPDLFLTYGELATAAQTAVAVVDRATDVLARALDAGVHLDADEAAAVAALVATAETVTSKAALHITARVLELADAPGLDRFWRNARALTAHGRPAHRLRAIGEHYLNGPHAEPAAALR